MKQIGILLLSVCVVGCASPPGGVIRTDLTEWKTIQDAYRGITIDMPADQFMFRMHHIPRFMGDSLFMIVVDIDRMSIAAFEERREYDVANAASQDKKWLEWLDAYHPDISSWDTAAHSRKQYRRDIKTPDDQIVRMEVQYKYHYFTSTQQEEDEQAIRRILASARLLDQGTAQQSSGGDSTNRADAVRVTPQK